MEDSFRSPRTKRSAAANGGGSFKRSKPPPPLTVAAGHVLFRLLCPLPLSGGVIGKSGAIVKQLQQDTAAKIRVEESPPGCDERIIVIIASSSVNKKIALKASKQEGEEMGEVIEVSAAQEALVRVFERVVEVAVETDGVAAEKEGGVPCRLLVESSQVGGVIGKGGKVIGKIRQDTGCKIRVLSSEKLPSCALQNDELIEIEGDVLAVKKALLTVSGRLQDCPPVDRPKTSGRQPIKAIPQGPLPGLHRDLPQRCSILPPMPDGSVTYVCGHPFSIEAERVPTLASRTQPQEVVFRLLCSNDRAGGVIGRGGTIVKALQDETGASINVAGPVAGCDERLITITAMENPESRYSPTQNAVILVFNRSIEAGIEKGLDLGSKGSLVSARVVVPSNQVGCLLGKGGIIISEMRNATGAGISIIAHEQVPKCASELDEVVQITGEFVCVQDALYNVTGRLRDNLFPSRMSNGAGTRSSSSLIPETTPYERAIDPSSLGWHTSVGVPHNFNRHTTLTQSIDHHGLPYGYDHPPSPRLWASQTLGGVNPRNLMDVGRGPTSVKSGLELGSGGRSAIVTNTTVEIVVPENVIGSVYGENGSNLTRLRQISGAKVEVHESLPGANVRTVVISGTPDETQAAQSLLQAFILTGTS
ncbi:KH domain-containing protein [Actinidia chinensis var. chinensis]|uniref:KH domain-containing protein n=1 Tax=Actinidia chinensis var. chinensis TaxID=1590841 RepID=A0A2R6R1V2_ACTCC|nr:KH domain-containing protein [Actinidia chinensis var. chinensis]